MICLLINEYMIWNKRSNSNISYFDFKWIGRGYVINPIRSKVRTKTRRNGWPAGVVAVSPRTRRLFGVGVVGHRSLNLPLQDPSFVSSPFRSPAVDSSPESRPKEENDGDSDRHAERGGGSLSWRCEGRLGVDVVLLWLVESMEAKRLLSGKEKKIKRKEVGFSSLRLVCFMILASPRLIYGIVLERLDFFCSFWSNEHEKVLFFSFFSSPVNFRAFPLFLLLFVAFWTFYAPILVAFFPFFFLFPKRSDFNFCSKRGQFGSDVL